MFIAITGSLLISGLFCVWISLQHLIQLDMEEVEFQLSQSEEEPEEEEPKLTRLGRPVEEVRLRA